MFKFLINMSVCGIFRLRRQHSMRQRRSKRKRYCVYFFFLEWLPCNLVLLKPKIVGKKCKSSSARNPVCYFWNLGSICFLAKSLESFAIFPFYLIFCCTEIYLLSLLIGNCLKTWEQKYVLIMVQVCLLLCVYIVWIDASDCGRWRRFGVYLDFLLTPDFVFYQESKDDPVDSDVRPSTYWKLCRLFLLQLSWF